MVTASESMSRQELESIAAEAGIADPGSFENKAALIAAINGESGGATAEAGTVSDQDRDDVLRELHQTGRVRQGFLVNYAWPDVVRKVG